jgi:hypothetical protein
MSADGEAIVSLPVDVLFDDTGSCPVLVMVAVFVAVPAVEEAVVLMVIVDEAAEASDAAMLHVTTPEA